jgi:hypothetical protein
VREAEAVTEQLAFDFAAIEDPSCRDFDPTEPRLADELADWRRVHELGAGGAGRLLRELVRRGLAEDALEAAAALVLFLEHEAQARRAPLGDAAA